jgi:polyisoprenyl-phosphate glycosyltransferase
MTTQSTAGIRELIWVEIDQHKPAPQVTLIVPCYNEAEVIPETGFRLIVLLRSLIEAGKIGGESSIYFIDDGSKDNTWQIIESLAAAEDCCHGIKLSRNHGHQNALLAGLLSVPGDVVISLDADLQDDISAIPKMIAAYAAGAEIVYGVRSDRETDGLFKRVTAEGYYHLLKILGANVVFNHADYRLLSRKALEVLREYREANLFLRGLIPQLGFNTAIVHYERKERWAGETKYPAQKMLALAIEGITSFSAGPLKLITVVGVLISFFSFGLGMWALWAKIFKLAAVPGWASTVIPIYMLGGIQLLSIGIIGQYLAKVYIEIKARPRFTIEKML